MNRRYYVHCKKVLHPNDLETLIRAGWGGMDIAEKYMIINMEENMAKVKEKYYDLQKMSENIMTDKEIEEEMKKIFKENEKIENNKLKKAKRSAFINGFLSGWGFVVVLNLLSYFI